MAQDRPGPWGSDRWHRPARPEVLIGPWKGRCDAVSIFGPSRPPVQAGEWRGRDVGTTRGGPSRARPPSCAVAGDGRGRTRARGPVWVRSPARLLGRARGRRSGFSSRGQVSPRGDTAPPPALADMPEVGGTPRNGRNCTLRRIACVDFTGVGFTWRGVIMTHDTRPVKGSLLGT